LGVSEIFLVLIYFLYKKSSDIFRFNWMQVIFLLTG
jgi:hypothetical protein